MQIPTRFNAVMLFKGPHPPTLSVPSLFSCPFVCSFYFSLLSLFLFFIFSPVRSFSFASLVLLFLVCFLVFSFSCPLGGVCRSFDCSLVCVLRIHEFCLPHIDALLMCRFVHCSAVPCLHSPTVTSTVVARALAPHKLALLPFYRDDRFPHTWLKRSKVNVIVWHWPQARVHDCMAATSHVPAYIYVFVL